MRTFLQKLSFLLISSPLTLIAEDEKSIVVIIPSYNNKDWYERNLNSVLSQEYDNFEVIYIDDASTDGTALLVEKYLSEHDFDTKVKLIKNQKRVGSLANLYHAIWLCDPTAIVVTVDGDDWLFSFDALKTVNKMYANEDVWMTYGCFYLYPQGYLNPVEPLSRATIENNAYRDAPYVTSHLRTFYAGLFHQIQYEDLLYEGQFFRVVGDLAFMFALLEMSGEHTRFIHQPLYVYNVATPLSDNKLYLEMIVPLENYIRQKRRYKPLLKLF